MMRKLATSGNESLVKVAQKTMAIDPTIRLVRATVQMRRNLLAAPRALAGTTNPTPLRSIFDSGNQEQASGNLARGEGQAPSDDVEVNEAYDGLGSTFKFYSDIFLRNSIDGNGMPLNAYVHFGQGYDNAFWDGSEMVFGDGDGQIFNRFTISLDVIGHELTHGVTAHEVNLAYVGQSGALNESISDVFGSMIKQYALGQTTAQADWLIGAGLLAPGVNGVALRSMKAPGTAYDDPQLGKDPQPADMDSYVDTQEDNGGVHTNSGVPNRAFYEVANALGGNSWDKAGPIWYDSIRDTSLQSTASFSDFAQRTIFNAGHRFGSGSDEVAAVKAAWDTVKVQVV